jgi:murein DD-endopeptidase MepM/ murein hydrolase activator NlpD
MQGNTGRGARAGMRRRGAAAVAAIAVLSLLPAVGLTGQPDRAYAAAYPTWPEVQAAIADVNANVALQKQVQGQIDALTAASAAAQADAEQKGIAYGDAQDRFDEQDQIVQDLQGQVDAAKQKADAAKAQVDGLLADIAKRGSTDLTSTLVTHGGDADDLLYRLGTSSKLAEQTKALYSTAIQQQQTIQKLTDQNQLAKEERDRRQQAAQQAFEAAQAAATAAQAAVDAESQHKAELEAQLTALQQKRTDVQAGYEAGVAAARAAAAAAAAAAGGGSGGAAGEVNPNTGWGRPASGPITSGFGMRTNPVSGVYKLHTGTDIGAGCGAPIYAAHNGTVIFSGVYSDLGNFIEIANGDGTVTGYGHIMNGGLLVRAGQSVAVGSQIAKVGATGGATGCHLHYMVRINGSLVDPVPFMRGKGMPL